MREKSPTLSVTCTKAYATVIFSIQLKSSTFTKLSGWMEGTLSRYYNIEAARLFTANTCILNDCNCGLMHSHPSLSFPQQQLTLSFPLLPFPSDVSCVSKCTKCFGNAIESYGNKASSEFKYVRVRGICRERERGR